MAAKPPVSPPLGPGVPSEFRLLQDTEYIKTSFPQGAERVARNILGQFTSLTNEMKKAFEDAAKDLQREEVKALKKGLRRPQGAEAGRPEENLVRALLSDRNRRVTVDGLAVNLVEWLDSPASKVSLYWRGLEDGTSKHVGQRIYGFFLGVDKQPYRASSERRYLDPRMIVGHSAIELRAGGEHGIKGKRKIDKAREVQGFFRIKHRIEPVHFISKGITVWEGSHSLQKHTEDAMKRVGLRARSK